MKQVGLCILIFLALFVTVGYLLPSEVHIKRRVKITAPIAAVYWNVSELKKWEQWSGLVPTEPICQLEYIKGEYETDSGFCWQTKGFESRKRRLLVTGTSFCDSLSSSMSFDQDKIASNCFRFSKANDETIVSWDFSTNQGNNIFAKWKGLLLYPILAPDIQKGLDKLKKLTEAEQRPDKAIQITGLK